jgi:hypothetical protein
MCTIVGLFLGPSNRRAQFDPIRGYREVTASGSIAASSGVAEVR